MYKKLKSCPFCGESEYVVLKPKHYHGSAIEIKGHKFWRVECLPCDARTGNCFDGDAKSFGFKDGKEMAIFQWNLRETGMVRIKTNILFFLLHNLGKLNKYLEKKYRNRDD